MDMTIRRREGHVSGRLKEFASQKLQRLGRFMPTITSIDLELYEDGSPKATGVHVAELTVATSGPVFRSKGSASDQRASIDMAVERLERRVKEFKRRRSGRPAHASSRAKVHIADTSSEGAAEDSFSEVTDLEIDLEIDLDSDADTFGGSGESREGSAGGRRGGNESD
jgi:ribosomal subunit interface protein